jgi:WD40 repeat protein
MMMWSVPKRSKVQTFALHHDWVINTAISPNGRFGASSSVDGSVVVWNLVTGQSVATIKDTSPIGSPIGFTGDGKFFIATSASDGLTLFSVSPSQGGGSSGQVKPTKKKK